MPRQGHFSVSIFSIFRFFPVVPLSAVRSLISAFIQHVSSSAFQIFSERMQEPASPLVNPDEHSRRALPGGGGEEDWMLVRMNEKLAHEVSLHRHTEPRLFLALYGKNGGLLIGLKKEYELVITQKRKGIT